MDRMKKRFVVLFALLISGYAFSQEATKEEKLLDEVSTKMTSYTNMELAFSASLLNPEAGIKKGEEDINEGKIILQGEKYNLEYLRNTFIYNGKKLYVINHDDKEITVNDSDLDDDEGFIYPSKLLTFYKEGYNYKMGKLITKNGRKIQYVELTPIDSNSEIVSVSLGIDSKTKHIYQLIQTGANGATTTLTITQFKSNQKISDQTFMFDQKKYEELDYLID